MEENKTQILYKTLSDKGLYTKSFDEFSTQYSDPTKRELLHQVLGKQGLYTKSYEEFNTQFFPEKKKDLSSQDAFTSASGKEELPFLGQSGQNIINPQDSSTPPLPSTSAEPVQNTETFTSPEQTPIIEQPKPVAKTVGEWVLGTVKAFDQSLAGVSDAIDHVQTMGTDAINQVIFGKDTAIGIKKMREEGTLAPALNPIRPFEAISDAINYAHSGAKPLPKGKGAKGVLGDVLTGAASTVPTILASIYSPETQLPLMYEKLGIKIGSKFGTILGTQKAIEDAQQAEGESTFKKVEAPILGMVEGYFTGAMFDGLGETSSKIGQNIADKIMPTVTTQGQAINKALIQQGGSMLSNALFFGGYGNAEEYLRTGTISPETFATNAGMGMVLGIREPAKLLFAKGLNSFIATPKEAINRIIENKLSTEDLSKEAQDGITKIESGTSTDIEADLAKAKFNANLAGLNAIVNEIRDNKEGVVKAVTGSEIDPKVKDLIIDKINEVDADNDPKIQATKDVNDKIAKIDDALDNIRSNKSWDETRKEIESAPLKERKLSLKEEALKVYGVEPKEAPKGEDGKVKEKPKAVQTESSKKLLDEIDRPKEEEVSSQFANQEQIKPEIPLISQKESLPLEEKPMETTKFNYTVIKETPKAIQVKIPYWESTDPSKKKNKQLYYETWIPKSIIDKGDDAIKQFVLNEREKKRTSNPYQNKLYKQPLSWKTMGEIAPERVPTEVKYEDVDARKTATKQIIDEIKSKYPEWRGLNRMGDMIDPPEGMSDKEYEYYNNKLKEAQSILKTVIEYKDTTPTKDQSTLTGKEGLTIKDLIGKTVDYQGKKVQVTGEPVLKGDYYELKGVDDVGETVIRIPRDEYDNSYLIEQIKQQNASQSKENLPIESTGTPITKKVFRASHDVTQGVNEEGVFYTSDKGVAESYLTKGKTVKEEEITLNNPMVVDAQGKDWQELIGDKDRLELVAEAKTSGYDGLIIKNQVDVGGMNGVENASDIYIKFSPQELPLQENIPNTGENKPIEPLTPQSDSNIPPTGDNGQNTSKTGVNEPTRTREIGRKAVEDSTLPDDVKKELTEKGIEYVPRGKKFTDAEAKQIVDLYEGVEGGLDKLSAEVYNTSNGILPDTRTYLNTIIAEKLVTKLNATTDVKEKTLLRDKLTDAIIFGAEQGTLGGQLVEAQKRWGKVLASDPELMITSVHEKLDRENKEFFADKQTEVDFVKKTIEDFLKGDEIKKVIDERVKETLAEERKVKVPAEKIKAEQEYRKKQWEAFKKPSDTLSASVVGFSKEQIEAIGNIAGSFVREGYFRVEDIITKVQKELKDITGTYLDDETIKGMLPKDIQNLKEPTPKVKKPRKEKIKVSPSQEEVVNKLFEKMAKFATRKQMSNFVMDYMEELSAKGVITDPRFRAILAKALGRDYVSEVTETKITEAAKTLGKANAKSEEYAKSIEDILEEYSKAPTTDEDKSSQKEKLKALEKNAKAIKKDWDKSVFEAEKANQKIKEALNEQPDLISRVGTLIQGGLLIPSSQVANIFGNLAIMPATAPAYLIAGGVDAMYSSAMRLVAKSLQGIDPIAHPDLYHWAAKMGGTERTTLPLEYFKGYWQSAPKQTWKGIQQLKTGATSREIGKGDVQRGVHPIEALGNLFSKDRALVKRIGDLLEALPAGYMAEGQFRLLNLGDKPFRGGAEGGRLRELFELDYRKKVTEAKKLENPQEREKRLKYLSDTKETSRNKFTSQPDSESLKSAREQGDIATFAQTTQLSKWISSIDKSFKKNGDSTTGSIFGSVARLLKITNTPYVKIPINITMLSAELSCPPISFVKAIDHAIRGDKRAVMDDIGKMVISGALTTVALTFASKGFITTLSDDKDVRAAQLEAGVEEGRLNMDAIRRWLSGQDYSWQDGDRFRSIKRLGIVSVQMMSIAEAYKNMKPEQKTEMQGNNINSGISAMFAALPYMPKMALQQSILVGANNLIQATLGGEAEKDRWLTSQATVLSTTLYPSTVAAISQTVDPEGFLRETRDFSTEEGKIKKHIMNTFKDRLFMGNGLPAKVSIWGQPVMRIPEGEKWSYNLFGISKEKKYQKYSFGTRLFEIYQDYNKTDPDNAKKIFPSLPSATTKVGWNDAKMTPKQYEEYQMKVGTTRAQNAEAYVNSTDWDGASLDDKITELSSIYSKARRYAEAELYSWVNYKKADATTKSNWELMDKNNALPLPFMGTKIEKIKLSPQEIEQVNNMALRNYAQEIVPYLQSKPETLQTDRTDIDEKTGKSYYIEELNKEWSKALKNAKSDMVDLLEAEKAKGKK